MKHFENLFTNILYYLFFVIASLLPWVTDTYVVAEIGELIKINYSAWNTGFLFFVVTLPNWLPFLAVTAWMILKTIAEVSGYVANRWIIALLSGYALIHTFLYALSAHFSTAKSPTVFKTESTELLVQNSEIGVGLAVFLVMSLLIFLLTFGKRPRA